MVTPRYFAELHNEIDEVLYMKFTSGRGKFNLGRKMIIVDFSGLICNSFALHQLCNRRSSQLQITSKPFSEELFRARHVSSEKSEVDKGKHL